MEFDFQNFLGCKCSETTIVLNIEGRTGYARGHVFPEATRECLAERDWWSSWLEEYRGRPEKVLVPGICIWGQMREEPVQ